MICLKVEIGGLSKLTVGGGRYADLEACGGRSNRVAFELIGTPSGWALTLALAGLGAYLFATHAGHILSAAPYLLLLLCPLMHLFGHRGHGHGHREHDR